MKVFITLLAATLAVAAPTNLPQTLSPRSISGAINWYDRYDCTNPCVEFGMCLSGQTHEGMDGSEPDFIGWDDGCWDRPKGAHSIALAINNGHKFSAIDKTCAEFHASAPAYKGINSIDLKVADGTSYGKCTELDGDWVKAVYYHW